MLIIKLIRSLKGYIIFSATGGFIERLINLIVRNDINIWDIEKKDEIFYIKALAKDYKLIKNISKKTQVKTRVIERIGISFLINKYKKRLGILIGVFVLIIFLIFIRNFVWDIEIIGIKELNEQYVLSSIENLGIKKWAYIPSIDFKTIKQQAIIDIDGISWISINNIGSKISIEISESVDAPKIEDKENPINIKAAKSGKILQFNVLEGEGTVKVGDFVLEGDLLVSGIYNDSLGNNLLRHSKAQIIAQTEYKNIISVNFESEEKKYKNKQKNRYILDIFGIKIPMYIATDVKGTYDLETKYRSIKLFGIELPIGSYINNYKFYDKEIVKLDQDESRKLLEEKSREYEEQNFKDTKIIDKQLIETVEDDKISWEISYICEEDIGLSEEIFLN